MTATLADQPIDTDEWAEVAALAGKSEPSDVSAVAVICREAVGRQHSVVEALLSSELVNEAQFLPALARHLGWDWWGAALPSIPAPLREKFRVRVAVRHRLFPIQEEGQPLRLLTFDPFDAIARQAVYQELGERIRWTVCSRSRIEEGLRQGYGVGAEVFDLLMEGRDVDEALMDMRQETTILDAEDSEASVVRFVNQIIRQALKERATDIHVEPEENNLTIRYRVDGVLHEVPVPAQIRLLQDSVLSRLKIMARLDIAERRLPQDGRINLELEGKPIDVRVATVPTVTGESISLRLLGQERFDFERLQLEPDYLAVIRELLAMPNGVVLVTGPTGSGKSTTLYTFLAALNERSRRIVTVEDPVEHKIPGVRQVAVNPDIGLTFAQALRAFLRSDPNVIMVGEMRDKETAEIGIRSSLTGHLVFSTLHTNDSVGGITRLVDIGVEPYLIASSVRAFLAQRLVRCVCPFCAKPTEETPERLAAIGFPVEHADKLRKGTGCEGCRGTGYQGRMALMEICRISPAMEELITARASLQDLRAKATEEGMVSLRQYGWRQVIAGKTTVEEVLRVTAADAADAKSADGVGVLDE